MTDVAQRAGVSVSTVSYVLTGTRPISEATRERVLTAMAELGYQPNAMARGLASRRSNILGLLLPLTGRSLGATETAFVTGATEAARQAGYHLMLCPVGADDSEELRTLATQRLLDGFLVMEVQLADRRVELLRELEAQFVLIGRTDDQDGLACVDIDFDQTVDDAVAHLVGLGHRTVAYVNHSAASLASGYGPARRTAAAFEAALRRHEIDGVMVPTEDTATGGRQAIREARERRPQVTGVLVMNENAALGILAELREAGLDVPWDISVVSMVTSEVVADLASPTLTAMTSPGADLAAAATRVLLRRLADGDCTTYEELLPCVLEVRGTSARPRKLK
ncbi:LacI family DNA-binding transcriptional regulator [Kribbella sp. CA-293567]|uniref:LacI family DNA-binding transcriptional regulator n=1 Tax=Kribbella sp. CA-293567 TaxID=3002436 RepID=UPI0022DE4B2F|nr:LacI family DNA-binding transcriptional regulator [Kribbella sp. CA-293567]WBQ08692.1 LacI family DNA-binding transcriptional regulator [Kribbella sp. CA-293567]